jgi:hypothetical protein
VRMDDRLFIVVDGSWALEYGKHAHRMADQALCPIGRAAGHLKADCNLLVKFREPAGDVVIDPSARLVVLADDLYIRSEKLSGWMRRTSPRTRLVVLFIEGTADDARCVALLWHREMLSTLEDAERLRTYDLPPQTATVVDAEHLVFAMYDAATRDDAGLFAAHADRFLGAPHIITALFSHLMSIRTEDNLRFPIQVKKVAEQIRNILLETRPTGPRITRVAKSHVDLWAEVQGRRFAFLDGGAARISGLPGLTPFALRVGVYSVRPGIDPDHDRERFRMRPFVVADMLDGDRRPQERADPRRLQEAARYVIEPLTGLLHLRDLPDTAALLVHGPLVNQFTQYDEGAPHFIPFLSPAFLSSVGVERSALLRDVVGIPSDSNGPMWNQFMAVYAWVMRQVHESATPIAGVVERPTGRAVIRAVLADLEQAGAFTHAYTIKVQSILDQYDITDDFLFGCILREGEYLTPVPVQKNPPRRAQERWGPVVRRYPQPAAMLVKSEETNFPFRVELNTAGVAQSEFLARFLYHTARLLPRYAFPVGLDIADKYAKIPDWLSRGVSAQLSADVLRRAMKTGDARLVTQLRLLLARGPRDFFYRPSAT